MDVDTWLQWRFLDMAVGLGCTLIWAVPALAYAGWLRWRERRDIRQYRAEQQRKREGE